MFVINMAVEIPKITERTFFISLPKKDNKGRDIKLEILNDNVKELTHHFEGSTIIPNSRGCYKDNDKLICEDMFQVILSRDFSNPYSQNKKIIEFRNNCTDKFLNNINSERCVKLANEINDEDRKFIFNEISKIGERLGQDTIFVREEIDKDIKLITGKWKESLEDNKVLKTKIF